MSLGGSEILVIALVAVLIFGPDKLPGLFRNLGRITAEIKSFQNMATSEIEKIAADSSEPEISKDKPMPKKYTEDDNPVAPIAED